MSSVPGQTLKLLAKFHNFSIIGEFGPNVKFDSMEGFFSRSEVNSVSVDCVAAELTFLIPPGEPYTLVEKMFMMFDFAVWIGIVITLLSAFIAIQVFNMLALNIQNFIYGRNIRTPTMNLISIFLTGGQCKIPARNFARFLLTLFIFWSLIIRTCYQSELFKYLQADLRKPIVQTIDELIEKNFTFYGSDMMFEMFLSDKKSR